MCVHIGMMLGSSGHTATVDCFKQCFLSNHDPQVTLPLCGSQKAPPSYKEGVV